MYIFQTITGSGPSVHVYQIGAITIDGERVSVMLGLKPLPGIATMPFGLLPPGAEQDYVMMQPLTLPEGAVSAELASQRAVAEWLISAAGPYTGAELVSDADYPLRSQKASFGYLARVKRDEVRNGGCAVQVGGEDKRIDTDVDSRLNIAGAVTMATLAKAAGQPFEMTWRFSDNSTADLDADTMIAIGTTVGLFVGAAQLRKNVLDASIDALTVALTDEQLPAFNAELADGWPS